MRKSVTYHVMSEPMTPEISAENVEQTVSRSLSEAKRDLSVFRREWPGDEFWIEDQDGVVINA